MTVMNCGVAMVSVARLRPDRMMRMPICLQRFRRQFDPQHRTEGASGIIDITEVH